MTFLLRAALVIGALSYLALMRGGADPAAEVRRLAEQVPAPQAALPAVLAAIPPETRERQGDKLLRDVLARGLMAELSRRAGEAEPASRDTLDEVDRRPAWRGVEGR